MITQKDIDSLYKQYKNPPATPDDLDIDLLFKYLLDFHDIAIDDHGNLIINSIPAESPFHKIPLKHVHAIVEFESRVAIVLHSSIIFLNKHNSKSNINIKMPKRSILSRLFSRPDNDV